MPADPGSPTRARDFDVPAALRSVLPRAIGYRSPDDPGRVHRGLPSLAVTAVFSLAAPIPVLGPGEGGDTFQALLGGLHLHPVLLPQCGPQHGLQLDVHPLACRALFGMPAGEFGHQVLQLADVLPAADRDLIERVWQTQSAAAGFRLIQHWVGQRLAAVDHAGVPVPAAHAWQLTARGQGRLPVSRVAAEVGWSARHLGNRIRTETGLGIKELARVSRFSTTVHRLRQQRWTSLAELAAEGGYYDQAHLSAEFRQFAGCSPTEWIRAELPALVDSRVV